MGASPSRQSAPLFSYFRGSYETGLIPLTKQFFGRAEEADAADETNGGRASHHLSKTGRGTRGGGPFSSTLRDSDRRALRQQLLEVRRDPAILYSVSRDATAMRHLMLEKMRREEQKKRREREQEEAQQGCPHSGASRDNYNPSADSSPRRSPHEEKDAIPETTSGGDSSYLYSSHSGDNAGLYKNKALDEEEDDQDDEEKALHRLLQDVGIPSEEMNDEKWRKYFWDVIPDKNCEEEDLDRLLDVIDEMMYETDEEMVLDPRYRRDTPYGPQSPPLTALEAEELAAERHLPQVYAPIPCALCLAYPPAKTRESCFLLEGRYINIIGFFGCFTPEMQKAFKIVKSDYVYDAACATPREETHQHSAVPRPFANLYLSTAILTSAGDRTLERVLALAAVMLRQQFHTASRKVLVLQRRRQQYLANSQHRLTRPVSYPHTPLLSGASPVAPTDFHYSAGWLHIPLMTEAEEQAILLTPLPDPAPGMFTTHGGLGPSSGSRPPQPSLTSMASSAGLPVSYSSDSLNGMLCDPVATESVSRVLFSSDPITVLSPPPSDGATPQSLLWNGVSSGNANPTPPEMRGSSTSSLSPHCSSSVMNGPAGVSHHDPQGDMAASSTVLPDADENQITWNYFYRLEHLSVIIHTASNNYSALKSLTENLAFLHCQLHIDPSDSHLYLIDLPEDDQATAQTSHRDHSSPSRRPHSRSSSGRMRRDETEIDEEVSKGESDLARASSSGVAATTNRNGEPSDSTKRRDAAEMLNTSLSAVSPLASARMLHPEGSERRDRELEPCAKTKRQPRHISPCSAVVLHVGPTYLSQAALWASGLLHFPQLKGKWIQYKLKDECEHLRQTLQRKDELIAEWRRTSTQQAAMYIGPQTHRLLAHVRRLQEETERARSQQPEEWGCEIHEDSDGRKYALHPSPYGTMLIGVRSKPNRSSSNHNQGGGNSQYNNNSMHSSNHNSNNAKTAGASAAAAGGCSSAHQKDRHHHSHTMQQYGNAASHSSVLPLSAGLQKLAYMPPPPHPPPLSSNSFLHHPAYGQNPPTPFLHSLGQQATHCPTHQQTYQTNMNFQFGNANFQQQASPTSGSGANGNANNAMAPNGDMYCMQQSIPLQNQPAVFTSINPAYAAQNQAPLVPISTPTPSTAVQYILSTDTTGSAPPTFSLPSPQQQQQQSQLHPTLHLQGGGGGVYQFVSPSPQRENQGQSVLGALPLANMQQNHTMVQSPAPGTVLWNPSAGVNEGAASQRWIVDQQGRLCPVYQVQLADPKTSPSPNPSPPSAGNHAPQQAVIMYPNGGGGTSQQEQGGAAGANAYVASAAVPPPYNVPRGDNRTGNLMPANPNPASFLNNGGGGSGAVFITYAPPSPPPPTASGCIPFTHAPIQHVARPSVAMSNNAKNTSSHNTAENLSVTTTTGLPPAFTNLVPNSNNNNNNNNNNGIAIKNSSQVIYAAVQPPHHNQHNAAPFPNQPVMLVQQPAPGTTHVVSGNPAFPSGM